MADAIVKKIGNIEVGAIGGDRDRKGESCGRADAIEEGLGAVSGEGGDRAGDAVELPDALNSNTGNIEFGGVEGDH